MIGSGQIMKHLLISLVVLACGACGGPQPPPFKPVVDVKQLMQGIVDPASDVVWESVATIYRKDGVEERRPQTKEAWDNVRNHAMMLAEAGNLLMMPPRAKDGGEWMQRAQELVDTATVALRAAEAKNVDQLLQVGGVIDEACENCHKKYWPNY
jgi:cytochrome c556